MPEKLKKGWARAAFGDVVRLCRERSSDPAEDGFDRYVGLEHLEPGDLKIRRWGNVADGTTFTNVFRAGQVLFGKRRAYQRKVAVADFDGVCSGDIYVLEAKDDCLLLELLPFICQTDRFYEHAVGTSAGSLSPRTNWESLAGYEFALPPLDEQRRIAEVLWAVVGLVERCVDAKSKCENLLASFSEQAFSEREWPNQSLGDLVVYSSDGPFGSKIKTEHYAADGVRVIRLNNIGLNTFNDADKAYLPRDYFLSELWNYEVKGGDVVLAGLGDDKVPAGRSCVIPETLGPALNKADCYCLRPSPELSSRFLMYFLNSPRGLAQSEAFAQGTTRMRMNLRNIKRMQIPVPPIEVQRETVHIMDALLSGGTALTERVRAANSTRADLLGELVGRPR